MGKLAIVKVKMARVSVKMEIEKYEAHWAQANCPSDTEICRYRHHASSNKLLLRSMLGVLHFPACRVEFLSECIKSFNLASTFTVNGSVIHIFAGNFKYVLFLNDKAILRSLQNTRNITQSTAERVSQKPKILNFPHLEL